MLLNMDQVLSFKSAPKIKKSATRAFAEDWKKKMKGNRDKKPDEQTLCGVMLKLIDKIGEDKQDQKETTERAFTAIEKNSTSINEATKSLAALNASFKFLEKLIWFIYGSAVTGIIGAVLYRIFGG